MLVLEYIDEMRERHKPFSHQGDDFCSVCSQPGYGEPFPCDAVKLANAVMELFSRTCMRCYLLRCKEVSLIEHTGELCRDV